MRPLTNRRNYNLQATRSSKRTDGKPHEYRTNYYRDADNPVSYIACVRAKRRIQPSQRKYHKRRANHLMKELPGYSPEPSEASWFTGLANCSRNRGHDSSLAQGNEFWQRAPVPKDRYSDVDRLRTT